MRTRRYLLIVFAALFVGLVLRATTPLHVETGTWAPAGQMSSPRTGAATVLLPDGRVMISGGTDANGNALNTAEFFNIDGTFSPAPSMNTARSGHAAIVLLSGEVMVTGGSTTGGGVTNSVETFNPPTNTWTTLPVTLGHARNGHALAQLADGSVLVAGGENAGTPVTSLETYSLDTSTFSFSAAMMTARKDAAAAALPDGRVLIAGGSSVGSDGTSVPLASTLIYDPATGTLTDGPGMSSPRARATATTTYDGVAIIGGNDGATDLGTADIYSQWTNTFRAVSGATPRSGHLALLLPNNGGILVTGGSAGTAVEILQPWRNNKAGMFLGVNASLSNHDGGFLSPIGVTGLMLAVGGKGDAATNAELYGFPTIATDKSDYAPGTTVFMTGAGFQQGEIITIHLDEWVSKTQTTYPDYTVTADANGGFTFSEYAPTPSDLNSRYHLTAIGQSSGWQAQTVFTDANNVGTNTQLDAISTPLNPGQASVSFSGTVALDRIGDPAIPSGGSVQLQMKSGGCNGSFGQVASATINAQGRFIGSFTAPAQSGQYSYQAQYQGASQGSGGSSTNWQKSTSTCQTVTVAITAVATTTSATASPTSPKFGEQVTFAATLSPSTATGTVSFYDAASGASCSSLGASTRIGTQQSVTGGTAAVNTSSLSVGPHSILACYVHTGSYQDSSGNVGVTVAKADQTISFDISTLIKTFGDASFALAATGGASGNPVTFATAADNVACSVAGTTATMIHAGLCSITASQTGNSDYNDATPVTSKFTVAKANQTITFDISTLIKTFGDAPFALAATGGASGNPVTFATAADNVACSVAGTTATIIHAGLCSITASQTGNSDYKDAPPVTSFFTVAKANQTITFDISTLNKTFGDAPFTVSASGGASGNPVTFATAADNVACSVAGTTATMIHAGLCSITASQTGNSDYNDASPVTSFFTVAKANQTITFDISTLSKTFGDAPFTVSASGGASGNPVTFATAADNIACSITGSNATIVHAGLCSITASQTGNNDYKDAAPVTSFFTVAKANQTITFGPLSTKTYGDPDFTVSASASSELAVAFAADGNCTVSGNTVHITAAGSCKITASQNGNDDYNAASTVDQTFTIDRRPATVIADSITKTYGELNPTLTAHVTGPVNGDTLIYTLATTATQFSGVANYPITVTLGSNPNYDVHTTDGALTVERRPATVAADSKTKIYGENNPALTATVTNTVNGDALDYSLATTATQFSSVGGYPISVTLGSNPNYSVTPVNGTLTINQRPVTISASSPTVYYGAPVPVITASFNGFVNSENSSVLTTQPTCATAYTTTSLVGSSPSTSCSGAVATNYSFSYVPGSVTVLAWTVTGFYQPITPWNNPNTAPVWNTVKGGSTVPLKFNIYSGTQEQTSTSAVKTPSSSTLPSVAFQKVDCSNVGYDDPVEYTVTNTGSTILRYDSTGGQFIQNWQTPKDNKCYLVRMTAADGSSVQALFKMK